MNLKIAKDNASVLLKTKCAPAMVLSAMTSQTVIIYIKRRNYEPVQLSQLFVIYADDIVYY